MACSLGFLCILSLVASGDMPSFSSLFLSGRPPVTRNDAGARSPLFCLIDPRWISHGEGADQSRSNKIVCCTGGLADRGMKWSCFPLADRGGQGRKLCCCSISRSVRRLWSSGDLTFKRGVGCRLRYISGRPPWWMQKQEIIVLSSIIKCCYLFFDRGEWWIHLLPAGRGGEGRRMCCYSSCASFERLLLHHRAPHAGVKCDSAIYGHRAGHSSSTSNSEAISIWRRSSASRSSQVVRPRLQRGSRRLIARRQGESECFTVLRSRRSRAWRSPATGGGLDLGPDCFFPFCSRVCDVIVQGLSAKFWSLWAIDVKGLCKICNRPSEI